MSGSVLLTVVTVVLNDVTHIEKTLQSVTSQSFNKFQYIVVDGGSTDGTLEVIQRYVDSIDILIIENDNGIFDAMNKGLKAATGEWINFMNSGDVYSSETVLITLIEELTVKCDVVYGDYEVCYGDFVVRVQSKEIGSLWKGMVCSHQSIFFRTGKLKEIGFDGCYQIAADHAQLYQLIEKGCVVNYFPYTIAKASSGGVSDTMRVISIKEKWTLAKQYRKGIYVNLYYIYLIADAYFRGFIKSILPVNIVKIVQMKRKR